MLEKYLHILRGCPFFGGMNDEEILSIIHCVDGRLIKKSKEEYILHTGEETNSMGLVLSGSVLAVQEDIWGHRNIMAKIEAGDFFAEPFAATPGAVLNISVVALKECEILMLDVNRLLTTCPGACSHHNQLIRNLVTVLAQKVLLFNDKITCLGKRSTREKLLAYLSAESLRQGTTAFEIPYDRQQLADYLSVDRAAMSSELSKLQKEGLIETSRKKFVLHADVEM